MQHLINDVTLSKNQEGEYIRIRSTLSKTITYFLDGPKGLAILSQLYVGLNKLKDRKFELCA